MRSELSMVWSTLFAFAASALLGCTGGCKSDDPKPDPTPPVQTTTERTDGPQPVEPVLPDVQEPDTTTPPPPPPIVPEWTSLSGDVGSSAQWGSGWIDLTSLRDFSRGDKIRIRVGGSAKKILVRLLEKHVRPDESRGLEGGVLIVPEDRIVEFTLKVDRKAIRQISVHGGTNPWDIALGATNGPATLVDAYYLPAAK